LCIGVWLLTGGTVHELTLVAKNPTSWDLYDFWPVWVVLSWGAAIVIHLGVVLAIGLFMFGLLAWALVRLERTLRSRPPVEPKAPRAPRAPAAAREPTPA